MEFQEWWRIVRRRWWVPAVLVAATALVSLLLELRAEEHYRVALRMAVSMPQETRLGAYYGYNGLYSWQASEYLVDDLGEILRSDAFAQDVKELMGEEGAKALQVIQSARPQKTHRILAVTFTVSDQRLGWKVGQAVAAAIEQRGDQYLSQLSAEGARVKIIDPPSVQPARVPLRIALELLARLVLALVAGVGLALFLHVLDPTVSETPELERSLGLPVLGAIPPDGSGRL